MNRVIDFFRFTLISPEIVWAGFILIGYLYFNEYFDFLGKQLKGNSDLWKILYALPFVFFISTVKSTGNLRSPLDKEENKALYEWPMYTKLTDRVIYSLVLGVICCIGIILTWVFSSKLSEAGLGAFYMAFLGVAGISAFILILAVQKLKEILTKYA